MTAPSDRLVDLARRCGAPPHAVALAAVALLLRRYTGRPAHTLTWTGGAVHVDLADDPPVRDLVRRVAAAVPAAAPADSAPLAGTAPAGHEPLAGAAAAGGDPFAGTAAVDLRPAAASLDVSVVDCPPAMADDVAADLATLLDAMAADPDAGTADLLPVAAYERRRPPTTDITTESLFAGHAFAHLGASGATIPSAFAAVVAAHPDRHAVLADDASMTYRELAAAVAATARAVRAAVPAPSGAPGRAALLCRHGPATVTGLLAALVTGRAYVPLEPTFPPRRLAEILADSAPDVLVIDAAHADLARRLVSLADLPDLPVVHIERSGGGETDPAELSGPARPEDPAYLLYTSGSTGAPKGVVQSHRSVLFGIANHVHNFAVTPADRLSVLTSFGYDMAVTDAFGALLSGAAAVPVDVRAHGLGHLARTLARRRVTVYHSTPTVYRYLLASLGPDGALPHVRAVLLGGEDVNRHDVELARRHFAPDAVFVNGYGTTEISFAAQCHLGPDAALEHAVVPIGAPLQGVEVVLLDPAGRPTCLVGEILVRCRHVASGYWGRPELTAERFGEHRGVRAYRTGDLARRLPDGRLVFLGRADRLVKVRGHRVELGEVEDRLAALPGVGQAAVVARPRPGGTGPGDKEIVAYVVPARGAAVDPAALRVALAAGLPDFMLPRVVVAVAALPMGDTGKLDPGALPAPVRSTVDGNGADVLERVIGEVWRDVLGVDRVGRHTGFVELGGHSLLMGLVQQRLEGALGRRLPMAVLFGHPTVAGLAAFLRSDGPRADGALTRAADRMRRRRAARQGGAA